MAKPDGETSKYAEIGPFLRTVLLSVWGITSFILLIRLLLMSMSGMRLLRSAKPLEHKELATALAAAARELELKVSPRLHACSSIRSIVIWCWSKKPILLLSASEACGHKECDWQSIFIHELSHWRRRDHWWSLIAEIAVCIVPWQPLLWIAKKRLEYLSEQACDNWVASSQRSVANYAESLLGLTPQKRTAFMVPIASSKKTLVSRINRILVADYGNPRVGFLWTLGLATLAACMCMAVAFAQTRPRRAETINLFSNSSKVIDAEEREVQQREIFARTLKAADDGDHVAMNSLAEMYFKGVGVSQNSAQAMILWKKAAGNGNKYAIDLIGRIHKESFIEAVRLYREAAEAGNVEGMYRLGQMYLEGKGVEPNMQMAKVWLEKAAEHVNGYPISTMPILLAEINEIEKALAYAKTLSQRRLNGREALALFVYGYVLNKSGNYYEAKDILQKAARLHARPGGMLRARPDGIQNWKIYELLGRVQESLIMQSTYPNLYVGRKQAIKYYEQALNSKAEDVPTELLKMLSEAANEDAGRVSPIYAFALMQVEDGTRDIPPDTRKRLLEAIDKNRSMNSLEWYLDTAQKGDARAMYTLGHMYFRGQGVERNQKKARTWWKKASKAGHPEAGKYAKW